MTLTALKIGRTMAGKRKRWVLDDGQSRIEAIDVDGYPIHDFAFQPASRYDFGWPLQVVTAGDDIWCRGCQRKRYNTPLFAVELMLEGEFRFVQDGEESRPKAGDVFLVRPGSDNIMESVSEISRKRVMEITGPLVGPLINLTQLNRVDCFQPTDAQWLMRQYDSARQMLSQASTGFMQTSSVLAYQVMIELGRSAVQNKLPVSVRQAISLMEHRINADLSLSELCEHADTTQPTLHRLFVKHLGEAPISYYINLKMQTAKTSLRSPGATVKSVAAELGYDNQQYFSALFKRRVGLSPRQFQRGERPAATGGKPS